MFYLRFCFVLFSEVRLNAISFLLQLPLLCLIGVGWSCFHYHFFLKCLFISSLISIVMTWLFSSALFSLSMFVCVCVCVLTFFPLWLISSLIAFGSEKMLWYNFNFLKISKAWFVAQGVVYTRECSLCTCEKSIFCFKFNWYLLDINQVKWIWSIVLFKTCICCCPVAKLCRTLCDPMDCSTPGSPLFHYLLGFAQIRVHWVSDAV